MIKGHAPPRAGERRARREAHMRRAAFVFLIALLTLFPLTLAAQAFPPT